MSVCLLMYLQDLQARTAAWSMALASGNLAPIIARCFGMGGDVEKRFSLNTVRVIA